MKLRSVFKSFSVAKVKARTASWLRATASKIQAVARDDAGVALVAIVFVFGSAALVTTAMLVLEEQGIPAQLRATKIQGGSIEKIDAAVEVYILTNNAVPCPADGDAGTGLAIAECDDSAVEDNAGIVPWQSLGLSKSDAIDAYGNYYTFVVGRTVSDLGVDSVCEQVGGQYTGEAIAGDLYIDTSGDNTAEIMTAVYAIIGHGPNRAGAFTSNDSFTGSPPESTDALEPDNSVNDADGNALIGISSTDPLHDAPFNDDGDTDTIFDDTILYKQTSELEDLCEPLVENGDVNNFLLVDFEGSTDLADNFTTNTPGGGTANQTNNNGDGVAELDDDVSLDTQSQFSIDLAPTYVSLDWTPTVGTEGGLSIVTRSGGGNPTAPDTFGNGVTFRFWQDKGATNIGNGVANANTITILCDVDCAAPVQVGTVDLRIDRAYKAELYDDGEKVWARIYEIADPDNQASVYISATTVDEDVNNFPNFVTIINVDDTAGSTGFTSQIDDVLVARAMGAVAFDGDNMGTPDSVDFDGTDSNVDVQFTAMTLELWVRPTASLSLDDTFVSKWDTAEAADTHQSFLLAMNGAGTAIEFSHANQPAFGTTSTLPCNSSINPTVGEWTHIAVTFGGGSVRMYQNGTLATTCSSLPNINRSSLAAVPFRIGAGITSGAAANGFEGDIAEVRLWSVERSATEILDNYRRRVLSNDADIANLNLYWQLDVDDVLASGGGGAAATLFAGDQAICNATSPACGGDFGSLVDGAEFIGAREEFRLPFADDVCPGEEDSLFSCLYDLADSGQVATIPVNLPDVSVTMWGGGGSSAVDFNGASDSRNGGGGGGYGSGRFPSINGTSVSGQSLFVTVGAGGGAPTAARGGAGGGGTSVRLTNSTGDIAMLVGGGGGAGTGDVVDTDGDGVGGDDCDEGLNCGAGGGGGGVSSSGTGLDGSPGVDGPGTVGDACGGDQGTANPGGQGGNGTSDTNCANSGENATSTLAPVNTEEDGGGSGTDATGGAGDGVGGNNTVGGDGGGGGGGFEGGASGAYDTVGLNQGFGGGGASGEVDGDVESPSGEVGEDGGTFSLGGGQHVGRAGGDDDPEYSSRTFATCASSASTNTPGRGGQSLADAGASNGLAGCDGAVIIAW